jgi:hypothetical protein
VVGDGKMARHVFLVFSTALPGRDAEFNQWYDQTHIFEALTSPGFVAAQRFRIADTQVMPSTESKLPPYVTIYELDTDDLPASVKGVIDGQASRTPTDTVDRSNALLAMYTACAPRVTRR